MHANRQGFPPSPATQPPLLVRAAHTLSTGQSRRSAWARYSSCNAHAFPRTTIRYTRASLLRTLSCLAPVRLERPFILPSGRQRARAYQCGERRPSERWRYRRGCVGCVRRRLCTERRYCGFVPLRFGCTLKNRRRLAHGRDSKECAACGACRSCGKAARARAKRTSGSSRRKLSVSCRRPCARMHTA